MDPEVLKAGAVPNGFSSMGLQTHNPHDLTRGPSGSSGGTGAGIAASFAQFGLGTDTGGSVRGTLLRERHRRTQTDRRSRLSRGGIVPLALSFDTGGPMGRSVQDVALALGLMTGVDAEDPATKTSAGRFETDYTQVPEGRPRSKVPASASRAISWARILRWIVSVEASIETLKKLGAVVVDPIKYPDYIIQAKQPIYNLLVSSEFKAQITDYLQTTKSGCPKSFDEIVARANDPATGYKSPEGLRAQIHREPRARPERPDVRRAQAATAGGGESVDSRNLQQVSARCDRVPDAAAPATLITPTEPPKPTAGTDSATSFANETGFPISSCPPVSPKTGCP